MISFWWFLLFDRGLISHLFDKLDARRGVIMVFVSGCQEWQCWCQEWGIFCDGWAGWDPVMLQSHQASVHWNISQNLESIVQRATVCLLVLYVTCPSCSLSLSKRMHLTQHFPTVGMLNLLNEPIYFCVSDNSSLVVPEPGPLLDIVCDVKVNKLIWLGHGRGLSPGSEINNYPNDPREEWPQ